MTQWNTRIAPSPTGDMHFGTARTAYFSWLAARSTGGKFFLRIDDTDDTRDKPEYVDVIFDTMKWLGLDWDHTYKQSDRLGIYLPIAKKLVDENKAQVIDGGAIALRFNPAMPMSWKDEIAGQITITERDIEKDLQNLILIRSDGKPTYHFTTVVDDIDSCITWIIRGSDHLSNTARHLALYHALGQPVPKYSHVGLVFKDKKKLSKRDGAASMIAYRNAGYHPEAILNTMLRLGWGPKVDDKSTALIPREKALEMFLTQGNMRNQAANFDQAKLDSFDRKYKAMVKKAA